MLNSSIKRRLESIYDLPTIPVVLSEVLAAVDNMELSAKNLAAIIEKDQALTARVLKVANSPFYGFSRRISTIDLAIIVLGLNSIKEIVLSLVLKGFISKLHRNIFDIHQFWNYSIFCGSSSKYLARKLDYRLAGEAFVAGLMHDIGILIIIRSFTNEFKKIRQFQEENKCSLIEAEQYILNSNHCEIGAWLAEKWQLPDQLCEAINGHHHAYNDEYAINDSLEYGGLKNPLTVIVAMAEWFAEKMGFRQWALENQSPSLYFNENMIEVISEDAFLNRESAIERIKLELIDDYEKAAETHGISS